LAAGLLSTTDSKGATLIAGPGDAGLRAAIEEAQNGDTVVLTQRVQLLSAIHMNKAVTLQVPAMEAWRIYVEGSFAGELFRVAAQGILFESVRLIGSPKTDGLRVVESVVLRDCTFNECRRPVVDDSWPSQATVRLERVTASFNDEGLECANLQAKDCTFSFNGGSAGAGGWITYMEGCRFENNQGDGFITTFGTVKNSTFRFNGGFGMRFDPDPGVLYLSGCLFYSNTGGGLLLREEAFATVDNCTFTRHTGLPAIIVTEAHEVLFRHCTVTDNVIVDPGSSPWYPSEGAFALGYNGRVELQNCLVADNPTNEAPHSAGLVGSWIDGGGNVIGGPAGLSALRDNGGATLSLLPLPGSLAIDAGIPSDIVEDARGLSRLAGAAPDAGATEADADAPVDFDADGMPDIWEEYHGLSASDPADAASDFDGDGQTALREFVSRTDPIDPQSVLRIEEIIVVPPPTSQPNLRINYIRWRPVPGVTYAVEASSDLGEWRRVSETFWMGGIRDGHQTLLFEFRAETPMSFYRLTVQESPFE